MCLCVCEWVYVHVIMAVCVCCLSDFRLCVPSAEPNTKDLRHKLDFHPSQVRTLPTRMVIDWVRTCHLTRFCGTADSTRLQWMKMTWCARQVSRPGQEEISVEPHDKLRPINLAWTFTLDGPAHLLSPASAPPRYYANVNQLRTVDIDSRIGPS